MTKKKLRDEAAKVLDLTWKIGERGPKTMSSRSLLATWLDLQGRSQGVKSAIAHLKLTIRGK